MKVPSMVASWSVNSSLTPFCVHVPPSALLSDLGFRHTRIQEIGGVSVDLVCCLSYFRSCSGPKRGGVPPYLSPY